MRAIILIYIFGDSQVRRGNDRFNEGRAEQIAIGAAITAGEREFETIVAVRGEQGEEILPPCGNCRQILCDYMPEGWVIVSADGKMKKVRAKELLPFAYHFEE